LRDLDEDFHRARTFSTGTAFDRDGQRATLPACNVASIKPCQLPTLSEGSAPTAWSHGEVEVRQCRCAYAVTIASTRSAST
jgi:hypothetical protein